MDVDAGLSNRTTVGLPNELSALLADAVQSGIDTEDDLYSLVEIVLGNKTKPPAT